MENGRTDQSAMRHPERPSSPLARRSACKVVEARATFMDAKKCGTATKSGAPCAAPAGPSGFCTFHDPALLSRRNAGRRKGGLRRAAVLARAVLLDDGNKLDLHDAAAVRGLLTDTIQAARTGKLDARIAAVVGTLSATVLKALEQGDLTARLDALEGALRQRGAA